MWKHMQLLLKAMRLLRGQLSSLSLIMDVFETPACHTIYPPRPRPRYYHSKLQNSYPSNTDSISSSQETHTLYRYPFIPFHRILHTMPLTEFAHITLKSALSPSSLPHSFYTTWCSTLRAYSHASHTPFYLCQSISTPTDLYLVGV